jgi:ketosteroid isomerase-like protein
MIFFGDVQMASREEMLDTIHHVYDARAKQDVDSVMTAFHSHAAFELKGDSKIVEAVGRTEGHADVHATMAGLTKAFEFLKRDIVYTVVEGERVVVHSHVEMKFIPTNTLFATEILDVFTFKDGKIIQLEEFVDTALVKTLMGR